MVEERYPEVPRVVETRPSADGKALAERLERSGRCLEVLSGASVGHSAGLPAVLRAQGVSVRSSEDVGKDEALYFGVQLLRASMAVEKFRHKSLHCCIKSSIFVASMKHTTIFWNFKQ